MTERPILAVDFGTTNSLAGVWTPNQKIPALPLDPHGADPTLFRSLLYFPHENSCFYGAEAISRYLENEMEGRLFRSFKAHLPNRGYLGTVIGNRIMPLERIVGLFLLEIRKRSEALIGREIKSVLLGRPARYSMDPVQDGFARHRMTKAAEFAGFEEIHFLPEPLGAAFDIRSRMKEEKRVLVGDFGGGTSDFTLLKISNRPFRTEDVLAIEGCPLAGDALDSVFMKEKLSAHFGAKSRYRLPLGSNVLTMPPSVSERLQHPAHIVHLKEKETFEFIRTVRQCALSSKDQKDVERLLALVEEQLIFSFFERIEGAKRELSSGAEVDFVFDEPGVTVQEKLSKKDFETWATPVRDQIFAALDRALEKAGLQSEEVDLVCLTGGTAKVPLIREALRSRFGEEKLQSSDSFHSVQKGLVEAASMWGEDADAFLPQLPS
ncbi:MAG TPA: Hsp70 family protein [Pseudobdellovibrionaceae bacterium]|nr:Hsp70 family protein [Pseudobdellovibrionaceae bacterium]